MDGKINYIGVGLSKFFLRLYKKVKGIMGFFCCINCYLIVMFENF